LKLRQGFPVGATHGRVQFGLIDDEKA
jgi:hypothetical protein